MKDARVLKDILRYWGERDALAGKSIDAFYDLLNIRLNETNRAEYEIGYRATKSEQRKNKESAHDPSVSDH